ncbi:MAG TPA: 50S ribosomal protein L22 [Bacteroidales bacterium]|nr:50S ribosomal protein L22 [Bacteroidales bacterium]HOK97572.1 50S ribosomal protein L22 [Bacteroidales bacterium]
MGARKKQMAEALKEARQQKVVAILRDYPTSPRKMRYVIDLIRGMEVNCALDILKFSEKAAARPVEKLLLSAIANWQAKNEGVRLDDAYIFIKEAKVDGGRILKRLRPAPQGRAYRIRKRSNHVTLVLDSVVKKQEESLTN